MTWPPSLQQQEGTATSSHLPLNPLPGSGLQPQPPASTALARGGQAAVHSQAGEGQQAERGQGDPEQRGVGQGRLERWGLETQTVEDPPLLALGALRFAHEALQ